jgi:hypothetical protein
MDFVERMELLLTLLDLALGLAIDHLIPQLRQLWSLAWMALVRLRQWHFRKGKYL